MHRLLPALVMLLALSACGDGGEGDRSTERPEPAPARSTGSPTAAATPVDRYVALGDSYTAAPLVPPTDLSTTCLRSQVNYPALVAEALPGTRLTDVSCSGATTADVTRPQVGQLGQTGRVPPQIDAVTRGTDLVTIGLGGNDDQLFGGLISRCTQAAGSDPTGSPCTDSYDAAATTALDSTFTRIADNLAGVVAKVRDRAPRARILVVGYPQVVPVSGACDALPLAAGDYPFVHEVNRRLTEALRVGATRAGAEYVDVWRASAGHDICSADPWINGQVTSAQTALAYHPLAAGQQAVADLVLARLR